MRRVRFVFYALVGLLNLLALLWVVGQMLNADVRVWEWSL